MKTNITLEIENHLIKKFSQTSLRYATEISINNGVKGGIVDFITSDHSSLIYGVPKITCYEIKVSYNDYLSENGHNFFGDENYYVLTEELFEKIFKLGKINPYAGIYVYKSGRLYLKKECFKGHVSRELSIENRFSILDQMLMRWIKGRVEK